ncbi:carbohydrate ABC transporter permease [Microbacterium sp. EYE_5]|uniref:carbohydrate ABC transporter permease n=1 Tax=unclassified Microbacterium TaxID=2609290 RepID=UPI002002E8FC|nr:MULTISPECIES: carbohydrate ABC transporter permease [unclassified Microbacterium]MCK6080307.1 carbohydrate ABC transporter permease [Microbacterium sp. EYE_382]MCK6085578.1 carbohydrate ABC transporter permease [Microbacterium sp. EYE_384]MCK6122197.1 carbohydrate ABC transporter permease [Microbacterium sp. EYE_80]MCK6126341.1 carbohydrate ABC transporter permease [Microbacterium sp. EYE_79]MCK6141262.1 carbohydrate ABC transporter permease [Microbacterium sp. EYE_39]
MSAATATRSIAAPTRSATRFWANLVLIVIGALFAAPLLWVVLASVDSVASYQVAWPETFTLDNFTDVLTPELTLLPLLNSILLSTGTAVVTVLVAILAAYPLSRYRSRFNGPFLYSVLFASCLPITAIMVPVYSLFVQLRLINQPWAVALFLAASSLPMALWMTKNFMDSVPVELEQAAWVDGASAMRALWTVVVPLMRPALSVVFVFVFLQAWGNFFVPFVLLLTPDWQPAAVSIYSFFGQYGTVAYGRLAAYSLLYSLPVLGLYLLVTRSLGGSFALSGAVKG